MLIDIIFNVWLLIDIIFNVWLFIDRMHQNTNANLGLLHDTFLINPSPESLERHFQLNRSWLPIFYVFSRSVAFSCLFFLICVLFWFPIDFCLLWIKQEEITLNCRGYDCLRYYWGILYSWNISELTKI